MTKPTVRLGVVMDPIEHIKPAKDTTLAMLLEAQRRGYALEYMTQGDLWVLEGRLGARMRSLQVRDDPDCWYALGPLREDDPTALDVILMRKDPPFDMEYIYTTFLLEHVEPARVRLAHRAEREPARRVVAHFERAHPGAETALQHPQVGLGHVLQRIAAPLRLEQHRQGRVLGRLDAVDRVHDDAEADAGFAQGQAPRGGCGAPTISSVWGCGAWRLPPRYVKTPGQCPESKQARAWRTSSGERWWMAASRAA